MQILHQIHSKNYDLRHTGKNQIKYIIIHYTEMTFDDAISKLCSSAAKVSAHYVIKKNGQIYQIVGDFYRAWHAGLSQWKNDEALNDISIGIELDNLGSEDFAGEQINSLLYLLKLLQNKYSILRDNILGHSDIAPSRKIDPGLFFDWHLLKIHGFGLSFVPNNATSTKLELTKNSLIEVQTKLKKIGFNCSETGNFDKETSDVFRAFQLHFNKNPILEKGGLEFLRNYENFYEWDDQSDKILNMLVSSQ